MPDTKISALTALLGASLSASDLLPIVDTSAVLTKSITVQEFLTGILGSTGINGGTVTTSSPLLNLAQTWNAAGEAFTGWKLNITDTASDPASLLLDLQKNSVTQFKIGKSGDATLASAAALAWGTDLILRRDDANKLAQRNGANAQEFNLYGGYADGSNYSRLRFSAFPTYSELALSAIGSYAAGATTFGIYATAGLNFGGAYQDQWQITAAGQLTSLIADVGIKCNAYKLGTTAFNSQTGTAYALQATDDGKIVTLNNAAGITLTIPASLGAQFNCTIIQLGAGQVTVVGSGATVNSYAGFLKLAGQYASANINATAANVLVLSGNLAA